MSTFTFNTSTWQALLQRGVVWEGVREEGVEFYQGGGGEMIIGALGYHCR